MANKIRITVTVDPDLIERIDQVCEHLDESRSHFIERALHSTVDEEERWSEQMESPVLRTIYSKLANPAALRMMARIVGESLTDEEIEAVQHRGRKAKEIGKKKKRSK